MSELRGELDARTFDASEVFPGTEREVGVYVHPDVRTFGAPAPVVVFQDGVRQGRYVLKGPWAMERLIDAGTIPPMVGVFISSGIVPSLVEGGLPRFNRSFEYDEIGDRYARFVLDEVLPWVAATFGLDLTSDPNDRAIVGLSSGGIAAFTAAWERPDAFHRVVSGIGSFTALRQGFAYPSLVRKVEPKPLRVYLQDGSNDVRNAYGDWWMGNQHLERSLAFAGYDVAHEWGDGGHDVEHLTRIFPDILTWLWRDHPAPVEVGMSWDPMFDVGRLVGGLPGWAEVGPAAPLPEAPNDVRSPDHAWTFSGDPDDFVVHVARLAPDGSRDHHQPYLRLHETAPGNGRATALTIDQDGWIFAATGLGIQVSDPIGRVAAILDPPVRGGRIDALAFVGDDLGHLEASAGGRAWRRPVRATGLAPGAPPRTPPMPSL